MIKVVGLEAERVALRKKDEELEDILLERMGWEEEMRKKVRSMLQYNVLTPKQISDLTGLKIPTLSNRTRPTYNSQGELVSELDFCYPFEDATGLGPKFIVRNEKLDKLLRNGRKRK